MTMLFPDERQFGVWHYFRSDPVAPSACDARGARCGGEQARSAAFGEGRQIDVQVEPVAPNNKIRRWKQRMKTKVEHRCMAKAKDAQAFVARMDLAKIKHKGYKTVPDLR